ncbi:MAG: CusA/CzcA family heavy metal efflux RND transporter, partial [Bdellovibrionales bacterium]|nr:CusA/CzcA family heavy metal efflux RND transporter [Bdellovibrionales bacterium]
MLNNLIRFSVDRPLITLLLVSGVMAAGAYSFQSLPIDAVPDITNAQVQINTTIPGLAPEEIERTVTFPIESSMGGITGVSQVRSITRFGLSQVTVSFEDGTDIYRARQLVTERLQNKLKDLPKNAEPALGPISSGLGEIYHYTVEAEQVATGKDRELQLMEIRAIQDWYIKPRLLTTSGVAEVNTIGGFEKQYHVQPDPKKMSHYGLHFQDLLKPLAENNENTGGGYVQQSSEQFLIQGFGLLRGIEDIKKIPVKALENLRTISIGDVASVKLASNLRTGAALVRGNETVLGSVFMLLGENSRSVSLRVDQKMEDIRASLPKGYKIETLYDRSDLVNSTLDTIRHNLLTGAILVVLFLLLLVGNVRAALITAVTIPITLLITFVLMKAFNISGNLMSLGALDFGIIVDGVVIVMDQCVRLIQEKAKTLGRALERAEIKETVYEAAVQMRTAAGFGELIIVVVFLPIFGLTGIEGKMFIPMAATFCFALVIAFVLSFTAAPAMGALFLSGKSSEKVPPLMRFFEHIFGPLLKYALSHRTKVIAAGVVSVVIGLVFFVRLGGEFLPQLNEGSYAFQFVRPVNISLDQSIRLQAMSEKVLMDFPAVKSTFSRIGTAEIATDPMGVNLADTYVMLKPHEEWPLINGKRPSKAELGEMLVAKLEALVPGQRVLVTQPIQMRFNELLEGTRADVSLKIFGEEMDKLAELTNQVATVIRTVPGSGDVETEVKGTSPLLRIEPQPEKLSALGLSKGDVLDAVALAVGGEEIGYIYEGSKRFPVLLRLSEEDRSDIESLRTLPIGIAAYATVPLEQLAKVEFVSTYGSVSRETSKRRAAVLINPRGRDTESFVREAQKVVKEKITLPPGYYMEWGGNFKNLERAKQRLSILAPIALLLVLMMIYAAFQSLGETLLVFSCVPLALVGGVVALMIRGLPFSISAGVGFIALLGIAVLNGLILVGRFNDLKRHGKTGVDLAFSGAMSRLRPVTMTALVDIFGFLPMMLATGPGAEVQAPLATVVIGGIISS